MIHFEKVQELAQSFLEIADKNNESVSAYIDGSDASEDETAYKVVSAADKAFTDAYNEYYGEHNEYGLNYDLAESVL